MSAPVMIWMSAKTVFQNLRIVLAIACVFALPIDILVDWAAQRFAVVETLNLRVAVAAVGVAVSFLINVLSYSALAWAVGQIIEGTTPGLSSVFMRLTGRRLLRILVTLVFGIWIASWPLLALVTVGFCVSYAFPGERAVLLAACLALIGYGFLIFRGIDYGLTEFPAVFEGIYFRKAAQRSKALAKGRRLWLFFAIILVSLLTVATALALTTGLQTLLNWPTPNISSPIGLLISVYTSLVNSMCLAVGIVFQTLVYFRLRREKHDLTFYDLTDTENIPPAVEKLVTVR